MMTATPTLAKFRRLARRLKLATYETVGLLEMLWWVTARNAPRGDIGTMNDDDIAVEIDWSGDPAELVEALVSTGWLDRHDDHRLVVHDWADHCPRYVRAVVARKYGGSFAVTTTADSSGDCSPDCSGECRTDCSSDSSSDSRALSLPIPTLPTPTSPSPSPPPDGVGGWGDVERSLTTCGVAAAGAATRAARDAGVDPPAVLAIVAHWREHRDGWNHAGAVLYRRVVAARPGESPVDGWPPPRDGWRSPAEREATRIAAAESSRDLADLARLEQAHGRALDSLSRDERQQIASECAGLAGQRQRVAMLRVVAARETARVSA